LIKIRLINLKDLDKGFPEILENLLPVEMDKAKAKEILQNIMNEPKHKIFVAEDDLIDNKNSANIIVGATTLLTEQKFIGKGMKVGYIEDVSVKKGYERQGIGRKLVSFVTNYAVQKEFCTKIILYCSKKNIPFYEKLDYKISNDTAVMKYEILKDKD
jgi:ribosomal protein S18 acetylase RimI-like enzyme